MDGYLIQVDAQDMTACAAELYEGFGHSSFGHVVHGGDAPRSHHQFGFSRHADVCQQSSRRLHVRRIHPQFPQVVTQLPSQQGGSFHGQALGEQDTVAGLHGVLAYGRGCCSHQGAGNDRTSDGVRDLRVPAHQHCACLPARPPHAVQEVKGSGGSRAGGEQHRGQEPAGSGAGGGKVVGVDRQEVVLNRFSGESDGIGGEGKEGWAGRGRCGQPHDRHVLADSGWHHEIRVGVPRDGTEETLQIGGGQLAVGQRQPQVHQVRQAGQIRDLEVWFPVGPLRSVVS